MTVGKLPVCSIMPLLDLVGCVAWVLSQHLKGIKGFKVSLVTTEFLLQASAQTTCAWLLSFHF